MPLYKMMITRFSSTTGEQRHGAPYLAACPVRWFGMAYFIGKIITVGGKDLRFSPTGMVYALGDEPQQWEEFLIPMPTARSFLSVATTSKAIVAAGGNTSDTAITCSSTVEVYNSDTSQWHTADPLPVSCAWMSSVTISNSYYLLGGVDQSNSDIKHCWQAFLPTLIQKAVSSTPQAGSVWSHLPPTPLYWSTAACLCGALLAIGGKNANNTKSSAVYAFLNNSWVRGSEVEMNFLLDQDVPWHSSLQSRWLSLEDQMSMSNNRGLYLLAQSSSTVTCVVTSDIYMGSTEEIERKKNVSYMQCNTLSAYQYYNVYCCTVFYLSRSINALCTQKKIIVASHGI